MRKVRKALAGGYHFKRISMGAGQEIQVHQIKMNILILGTLLVVLGGGEHKDMVTRKHNVAKMQQPKAKVLDFDVFS